jgi:hypothetical protein
LIVEGTDFNISPEAFATADDTPASFNAPLITPLIFPLEAEFKIARPLDNNFDVVGSKTPDLVIVAKSLLASELILIPTDAAAILICLFNVFASFFVNLKLWVN